MSFPEYCSGLLSVGTSPLPTALHQTGATPAENYWLKLIDASAKRHCCFRPACSAPPTGDAYWQNFHGALNHSFVETDSFLALMMAIRQLDGALTAARPIAEITPTTKATDGDRGSREAG